MSRKLFDEEFVTAQRKGHPRGTGPLSLAEFCALDHLLVSTMGGRFSGLVDAVLAREGVERSVTVSIQSYALAPTLLATSDLVCTLPRRFLQRYAGQLDLMVPPLEFGRFQLSAFWHPRAANEPAHVWLREQIFALARLAATSGQAN